MRKKAQTIRISIDTLEFIKIKSPKNNIKIGKVNISKRRYFQYLSMRKDSSTRKTAQFLKWVIHILEKTFYKREYPNDHYLYKDLLGIADQRSAN